MSLQGFLQASKAKLKNIESLQKIHVVIGNEACDLDSVVSAVVYAYFLNQISEDDQDSTSCILPVLNIPQEDFSLRTEVIYALQLYEISANDLIFRDQIDLSSVQDKLKLTLVDFHVLPKRDSSLEDKIVEILDHRKRELEHDVSRVDATIELVGSCCTLVAEKIQKRLDLRELPKEAVWLLYGTILLDTVCLGESAGRTSPKDLETIEALESLLPSPKQQQVFDKLQAAKFDVSSLTTFDLLRKDLKTISGNGLTIALSSLPIHIKDFLSRPDLQSALSSFTTHQGAAAIVLLSLVVDPQGEPHRQLAVHSRDAGLLKQVSDVLEDVDEASSASSLDLERRLEWCPSSEIIAYDQRNVRASRKVVLPLINAALSKKLISMEAENKPGEDAHLKDPFHNQTNILLENTPENTAATTPVSGQSTRSQSPDNMDQRNKSSSPLQGLAASGTSPSSLGLPTFNPTSPVTPINSPSESPSGSGSNSPQKTTELPSFHSQEMVQNIREKKASIGGEADISDETSNFPYTPVNSFADPSALEGSTEFQLPSFMNKEMVSRINQKKAKLDGFVEEEEEDLEQEEVFGNVPKNSYDSSDMENNMSSGMLDLSNVSSQEMAQRIRDKKTSLGYTTDDDDVEEDSGYPQNNTTEPDSSDNFPTSEEMIKKVENKRLSLLGEEGIEEDEVEKDVPFTPPSSFVDSQGESIAKSLADMDSWDHVSSEDNNLDSEKPLSTGASDNGSDVVIVEELGITVMKASSREEVAGKITESVIEKASAEVQKSEEVLSNDEFESIPSSFGMPAIVIEDCSSQDDSKPTELALEGIQITKDTSAPEEDEKLGAEKKKSISKSWEVITEDSVLNLGPDPGETDTDPQVDDINAKEQDKLEPDEYREANVSSDGSYLVLGVDPGESHTEPQQTNHDVSEPEIIMDPVIGSDGQIILGAEPGESNTDQDHNVPDDVIMEPVQSSNGVITLGADPGESSTDDVMTAREQPEGGSTSVLSAQQGAPVLSGRQSPEGSAAASKTAETTDGGEKTDDGKLTKQQRSHLEGVRKALDIDLDLSSDEDEDEDREEIKNLHDQIPEELSHPLQQREDDNERADRPSTLTDATRKKVIVPNLDLLNDNNLDLPVSPLSPTTTDEIGLGFDNMKTPDDLATPDILNDSMFNGELDWGSESSTVTPVEPIPEYTAREEFEDERHWRSVNIGGRWYKIDMKVIEPYKKVLSHGGYYGDGFNAIVVFTACYLPDRRRRDYHYVMDNLFLYVISTLELLVVEDYMIVYFHGATPTHKMPSLRWLKRCYDMIDRRLKKNLKNLLIVHPTIWLKTLVFMTKPFVSSKFSSKLRYIKNLEELTKAVPTEYIFVPDEVKRYDSKGSKSPTEATSHPT